MFASTDAYFDFAVRDLQAARRFLSELQETVGS